MAVRLSCTCSTAGAAQEDKMRQWQLTPKKMGGVSVSLVVETKCPSLPYISSLHRRPCPNSEALFHFLPFLSPIPEQATFGICTVLYVSIAPTTQTLFYHHHHQNQKAYTPNSAVKVFSKDGGIHSLLLVDFLHSLQAEVFVQPASQSHLCPHAHR